MKKHYKIYLILSVILSFILISGSLLFRTSHLNEKKQNLPNYTKEELRVYSGKNNSPCYVAIDGKVYSIKQGNLWKEGEHTTSNELAYCGLDLTEVIGKSPHGKSKLTALPVVGSYSE